MTASINSTLAEKESRTSRATKTGFSQHPALEPTPTAAKTFSLTRRIIAYVVTCQLLLTIGLSLVAVLYAREQLRGTFNTALDGDARGTLALVRYTESKPYVLMFDAKLLPTPSDPVHKDVYEILGQDGKLIAQSSGWQFVPPEVTQSNEPYVDFNLNGAPYRAAIMRNVPVMDSEGDDDGDDDDGPAANVTLIYAESLVENHQRLMLLAGYVGSTSLLLLVIANTFAILSIRRGLDPLHELAERASAISVRNWDFQPSPGAMLAKELSPSRALLLQYWPA